MWALLAVTPVSVAGWFTATSHAGELAPYLAPMGAAAPFAGLALYIIRRYETVNDGLMAQLARVNDDTINKFVAAINEATQLHRESTRMWEQVLDELRRRQ